MSLLVRGGTVLTMNDRWDVVDGDVSIRDGRIAAIGPNLTGHHDRVVEARGGYVLPGLIQTHIHLCQTLFRGYADDRPLMDWLRQRVWPMEAAHTPHTLRAAVQLATTELLSTGTRPYGRDFLSSMASSRKSLIRQPQSRSSSKTGVAYRRTQSRRVLRLNFVARHPPHSI